MGHYKNRQLALVEAGMTFAQANAALATPTTRAATIVGTFGSAQHEGRHVRFTVNGRSRRRKVTEVYQHGSHWWAKTNDGHTIRLDLVTYAVLDGREGLK